MTRHERSRRNRAEAQSATRLRRASCPKGCASFGAGLRCSSVAYLKICSLLTALATTKTCGNAPLSQFLDSFLQDSLEAVKINIRFFPRKGFLTFACELFIPLSHSAPGSTGFSGAAEYFYENQQTTRPTFILLGRHSILHPVRIRCHITGPDIPTTYPNYSRCSVPTNICYSHPNQCQCDGLHSSLVDFESIMIVLTEYTPGGKLVSTMDLDISASTESESIYYLKETYLQQIEDYKIRRRQMHGDYVL